MLSRKLHLLLIRRSINVQHVARFCSDNDGKQKNLHPNNVLTKDPLKRTYEIFRNQFKDMGRGKLRVDESKLFPSHVDVLILGGGIIGSSISYWLHTKYGGDTRVAIIDKDLTYKNASTSLSVGGIRQQFSIKENIELSLFAADFIKNASTNLAVEGFDPPELPFSPHGYLFLATDDGAAQLKENYDLQQSLGAKVQLMGPNKLKEKFPWLNTSDIALGCHGTQNEGWTDPHMMLMAIRNKTISLGGSYSEAEVDEFVFQKVPNYFIRDENGEHNLEICQSVIVKTPDDIKREINFSVLVIAGGAGSGEIAKKLKIGTGPGVLRHALPVEPRKRFVFVYNCPDGPGLDCPMVIDPSKTYFRREGLGGNFIAGCSPCEEDEPDISNLDVDHQLFEKQIWPNLANRVQAFESLKVTNSWAGYYDYNTFDQNAIIGNHPVYRNVIFATGFSGHGIQQAPGVGRGVAELIADNEYHTIDLSRFTFDRIIENNPLLEKNIV